jgi:hypothetical protein
MMQRPAPPAPAEARPAVKPAPDAEKAEESGSPEPEPPETGEEKPAAPEPVVPALRKSARGKKRKARRS